MATDVLALFTNVVSAAFKASFMPPDINGGLVTPLFKTAIHLTQAIMDPLL